MNGFDVFKGSENTAPMKEGLRKWWIPAESMAEHDHDPWKWMKAHKDEYLRVYSIGCHGVMAIPDRAALEEYEAISYGFTLEEYRTRMAMSDKEVMKQMIRRA